jgi:type I restriction enzyme M protein
MARAKKSTNSQPLTTAQRLSSIVKSCRDIMRKLRRPGSPSPVRGREPVLSLSKEQGEGQSTGGRAAVVVPNGTLFGDGVCARIKEELLKEFNLHTIVRLPNGVFAPYTSIPTNLLFFDRSGPTEEIWYYEQPLPEGRKQYTKTQPIQFEEFSGCLAWWKDRKETERAWKVGAKDVLKYDNGNLVSVNLDIKNPASKQDFEHLPPEQLADDILKKEQRIAEIMMEIRQALKGPVP